MLLVLITFHNHLRRSVRSTFLAGSLFYITVSLLAAGLDKMYGLNTLWRMPFALFFLLACVGLGCCVLKAAPIKTFFLVVLVVNYSDIVLLFSEIMQMTLPCPNEITAVVFDALCHIIVILVTSPIMGYFLIDQVRSVWENENSPEIWNRLWMIPLSFYLIYRLGFTSKFETLNDDITSPQLLAIVWTIGTFMSYYAVLNMINATQDKRQLQQQLQVREYQALIQEKQAERLATSIAITRQTRHDLHHYLWTLKTYIDQGDTEKMKKSLNQFINNFESSTKTPVCENLLFSAIIRYYMEIADEKGIQFSDQISLPKVLTIKDTDLTVLLGNVLENALEACERQPIGEPRFIVFKSQMQGENGLVIQCRNSYNGEIHKDGNDYLSSKREGLGIGLSSIKTLCAKYHGIFNITPEEKEFILSILLNLPVA